jgi:hypothetical protein
LKKEIGEKTLLQEKTGQIRMAALMNNSWNQDMPEIIKEIITINKFKDLAPDAK